jgi:hypothetical protein
MGRVLGVGGVEEIEYGRFGWFLDRGGDKVELWQPPAPIARGGPP